MSEAGADVCVVHLKHEASVGKTAAKWWSRAVHCLTAKTTPEFELDRHCVAYPCWHGIPPKQEYHREAVRFFPRFVQLGRI